MKKTLTVITLCFALTAFSVGCGAHTHEATAWKCDLQNHWQVCEDCGEEFNTGEHSLDEYGYCEKCGNSVSDYGDGTYEIMTYDEQGSLASQIIYDADGNSIEEIIYENEYFDDGNPKHCLEYRQGLLTYEEKYEHCEHQEIAEVYMSEQISYDEDGSKTVMLCDEYSNPLSYISYDADGNVTNADIYEYIYDDEGNLSKQICRSNDVVSQESYYAVDADGNTYTAREIFYNDDGSVMYENTYEQ